MEVEAIEACNDVRREKLNANAVTLIIRRSQL